MDGTLPAPVSERAGIISGTAIRQIRAEREAAAAADIASRFSASAQVTVEFSASVTVQGTAQ